MNLTLTIRRSFLLLISIFFFNIGFAENRPLNTSGTSIDLATNAPLDVSAVDCKALTASGGKDFITITDISVGTKLQYQGIGTGWTHKLICESGSCGGSQSVTGVPKGEYTITAQTFNPYCYKTYQVTVSGDDGGEDCNSLSVAGGNGIITINDIPAGTKLIYQGINTGFDDLLICERGSCGGSQSVTGVPTGEYEVIASTFNPFCFKRYNVTVTEDDGDGDCNNLSVAGGNRFITIDNVPADAKLSYQGVTTGGEIRTICESGSCPSSRPLAGALPGEYTITAETFDPYCSKTYQVTVTDGDQNGGDGDCNSLSVAGGNGTIIINDIPVRTKLTYQGIGTGWQHELICDDFRCGGSQSLSGVEKGEYTITAQTFNPYCYKTYIVTVTGGGDPTDPCANQGGDSDGDGICDNQDNCVFNSNPNQADNDGDGNGNVCDCYPNDPSLPAPVGSACDDRNSQTINDKIELDGCTCKGTIDPNVEEGDCNSLIVAGGNGTITINDIPGDTKLTYQGKDTGWNHQTICEGNCVNSLSLTGVSKGDYTITAQTFSPYCYKTYSVTVTEGGDSNDRCANLGGDTDGDGACDDQDNCISTFNTDQADNDGDGIGNLCDPTPNGSDEDALCNNTSVTTDNQSITVNGINNPEVVAITVFTIDWQVVSQCWNCNSSQGTINTGPGNFRVVVDYYNTSFGYICRFTQTVTVGGGFTAVDPISRSYKSSTVNSSSEQENTKLNTTNLEAISIYPNPASNELNFNVKSILGKSATIQMVNTFGQVVSSLEIDRVEQKTLQLSIGDIPTGLYHTIIQIEDQKPFAKKIVVRNVR